MKIHCHDDEKPLQMVQELAATAQAQQTKLLHKRL
jgi:hypothetical protein